MLFEEYYKIMKEHGIGELLFLYKDKECSILMDVMDFSLNYSISFGEEFYSSDDFDEIVSCKYLSIGKTLKEIWDEIEILSIDGVSENDYDEQICSYNYVERLKQMGELQWSYSHSFKKSFLMHLKYMILGVLILPVLSTLIPIFRIGNWNTVLLFGLFSVSALIVGVIVTLRNRICVTYNITTKRIFTFNGLSCETTYDNIKKVKFRKSIFNKGYGTIKLYVKKGLSLNYHIEDIPNPEEVYNLIVENIEINSNEQEK